MPFGLLFLRLRPRWRHTKAKQGWERYRVEGEKSYEAATGKLHS